MHRFVLHNNLIQDSAQTTLAPGQVGLMNGWGVFSTIRVIDGVMFAFERHWARMQRDAGRLRVPFPSQPSEMKEPLERLIEANDADQSTLRVIVVRNRGGMWEGPGLDRAYDLIAFTSDTKSWGEAVKLSVTRDARYAGSEFAGAKMLSWAHNLVWLEAAQSSGFDETILLNQHGQVSECTSANIFVASGDKIWTPPLGSGCLPGVTRQLLLTEVRAEGITIGEKDLLLPDLEEADAVFITSTTRGLLSVSSIEGLQISRNGSAQKPVQAAFSSYVSEYVADAKRHR